MFQQFEKRQKRGKTSWMGRELRKRWDQNDSCRKCGCKTILETGNIQNDNSATLDHLYSNLDIRRLIKESRYIVVLWCHKCNQRKAVKEVRAIFTSVYDAKNNKVSIINILNTGRIYNALLRS
jgi:hypothetical protein